MGQKNRKACEGNLRPALTHLMKIATRPGDPAIPHWRAEIVVMLANARSNYKPAMAQAIDVEELYRRSLIRFETATKATALLRQSCPFTLDDLLAKDVDVDALLAGLTSPSPP